MTMTPKRLWERAYGDFLMPSRLGAYRALLEAALGAGYAIISVERFWKLIGADAVDPVRRYLVLRHDIDTGPRTAVAMWQLERSLGIASSYYFRLSTLDLSLMADIAAAGGEASYHYEELATVAKRRHLRTPAGALAHLPDAQDLFRRNLERLRALTGLPMRVVAAHGDFVNRKLGLTNSAILTDPGFRREAGIELETYDEAFMSHITSRHADLTSRPYWTPADPISAIRQAEPIAYVLVHPRGWQVERCPNARDDIVRIWQGLLYALPIAPSEETGHKSAPRRSRRG